MKVNNTNIAVKNLAIGYKTQEVARNINFSLKAGELCAIVGINGIGKSTLLRTLGNIQPKLEGGISIQAKNLENFEASEMAKQVSVVLTEPIASKNLTVKELIALGRQPYTNWIGSLSATDSVKIEDSLAAFELEDLKNRK